MALAHASPFDLSRRAPWNEAAFEELGLRYARMARAAAGVDLSRECNMRLSGTGLWEVGAPLAEERSTAADLGRDLNARFGLDFALVANFKNHCTPGFDGVVIDASGRALANVSIKNPRRLTYHHAQLLRTAADASGRLCHADGWVKLVRAQLPVLSVSRRDPRRVSQKSYRAFDNFQHVVERHGRYVRMFATDPPRPLWLIVDIADREEPWPSVLDKLREDTAERPHLTTIVRWPGGVRVFRDGVTRTWAEIERAEDLMGRWVTPDESAYGAARTAPVR